MGWCGASSDWIVYGTINPCYFTTFAAVAILTATAVIAHSSFSYVRTLFNTLGPTRSYLWDIPGANGPHIIQAIAIGLLLVLHSLVLIFFTNDVHPAPYQVVSELLLVLCWSTMLFTIVFASIKNNISLRFHSLAIVAFISYAISAFSEVQFYIHGLDSSASPLLRKTRLAFGILSFVSASTILVTELFFKPTQTEEAQNALTQALLDESETSDGRGVEDGGEAGGDEEAGKKKRRHRSWISLVGIAARYVWPSDPTLQFRAFLCVVLIVALRLLNLGVPIAFKKVVDEFSQYTEIFQDKKQDEPIPFRTAFMPWVATWLVLYLLQGGGGGGIATGLLSNLRSYLWIPLGQYSFRQTSLKIFSHVLSMDHHFHLHRKTGEMLRIMDRGTASIQTLLSLMLFQIGPAIFDIVAAAVFLALRLKAWIACIVFTSLGLYVPMTIYLTEWRGSFRRQLNALDNARGARATDALLNYETVKLFGNEKLEEDQYAAAIDAYQKVDFKLSSSMNLLNIAQALVIWVGIAAGMMVCTAGVADGSLTVGDVVLFVTLMQQLYAPLNFFGSYYRMLQQSMMDMEGIFDLLATNPGVEDAEEATPHTLPPSATSYQVEFRDVSFAYSDGAPVLKHVNFIAPAGGITALVGATGSGKSSLLRLLLRFYDPTQGAVLIGDQDIKYVTQSSLRAVIGVVPQDTVLFNDTIKYNIRYGRPDASDGEVYAAAQGACIDETIRSRFPLGYETLVGERGLRLSGGEKQRVAFARALLKNPPILVLDEATSALDSITERRIQSTLAETRQGRTVVVVAHRLSTIMDADRIVVMDKGDVAEMGTHGELLEREGGLYAAMWQRQAEGNGAGGGGSAAASSTALAPLGLDDDTDASKGDDIPPATQ